MLSSIATAVFIALPTASVGGAMRVRRRRVGLRLSVIITALVASDIDAISTISKVLVQPIANRSVPAARESEGVTLWSEDVVSGTKQCGASSHQIVRPPPPKGRRCGVIHDFHIPKTGGSSLLCWFVRLYEEGLIDEVFSLYSKTRPVDLQRFEEDVLESVLAHPTGRLVALHNHHRGFGLFGHHHMTKRFQQRLRAAGCGFFQITSLRAPTDRLRSSLFYQSRKELPSASKEEVRQYMVNMLTSNKAFDNYLVRYTLNNHKDMEETYPLPLGKVKGKAVEAALALLANFDAVWILEDGDTVVHRFARRLGLSASGNDIPIPKVDVDENADLSVLTPEISELIKRRTLTDNVLYSAIRYIFSHKTGSDHI
eukprot:TRINITY_DN3858_c0_g1_i2.p1 TRINITY_DN3858_c0_g1~~TRINITY_DN3858_c0_g1_i2.p1  ORF type:complete len:370 (+),score=55.16 TRINITY_DN3858_c0_g1_i2:57-1166(+)